MKKCKNCGTESNSNFCPECGGEMVEIEEVPAANNICQNCGIEVESKFCPECGALVNPDAASKKTEDANGENLYVDATVADTEETANDVTSDVEQVQNINLSSVPVVETKKKMSKKKKILIGVIIVLVVLFALAMCGSSTPTSTTDGDTDTSYEETEDTGYEDEEYEDDEYDDEEDEMTDEEVLQSAKNYKTGQCKEISYENLARNPEKHEMKQIKISGRVVQLIEGDDNYYELRVAVNDDYDTIIYVTYDHRILESRILEDDYITLYGTFMGTITYESTMGGNITIPSMLAGKIVFD